MDEIEFDNPLKDVTLLDLCQQTSTQRSLKELKESSLEELKARIGDDELAEMVYKAVQNCSEGYMRIRKQWPSLGEPYEGWTYIFAAGMPLCIDRPDSWYHTSNIEKIDWEGKTFTTLNSIYSFEFLDPNLIDL